MNKQEVVSILSEIKFSNWFFEVHQKDDMLFLQVQFFAPNTDYPEHGNMLQKCRWWLIDTDKGESEVVRTAYKAIEAAVIHEMQEEFTYKNVRVMDPHRSLV